MKNLKKGLCTFLCVLMVAGSAMTVCAEEGDWKDCPITQVTPGGVNIYGYRALRTVNPFTGESEVTDWPAVYIAAIDAAGITNEMSDYEKATAIANYLCGALEYRTGERTPTVSMDEGENALLVGWGVCGGYAEAFENMCVMVNVECYTVGGLSTHSGKRHAWNEVWIDGIPYYTDVTWIDSTGSAEWLMSPVEWADHQRSSDVRDYSKNYGTPEYAKAMLSGMKITIGQ